MRWSRIKAAYEALLAERLQGRVRVHATRYEHLESGVGRGWINLDGEEVVSIRIPSHETENMPFRPDHLSFGTALRAYAAMPFDEAKASDDPILQGLTFLDRRFGKRSLRSFDATGLHPFGKALYRLRCEVEGVRFDRPHAGPSRR